MDIALGAALVVYLAVAAMFFLNCMIEADRRPCFSGAAGLLLLSAVWPLAFASIALFVVMSRHGARRGGREGLLEILSARRR